MKHTKLALALAFAGTSLFLTACNDDDNDKGSSVVAPQVYLSETEYTATNAEADKAALAGVVQSIKVMKYKMPSADGKTVETSAIVLFPKIAQPKDGYRVVVWAHGTLGVADKCAPSKTELGERFRDYTAKNLLAAGYVIVAPDYEGLGGAGIHPYLNIPSEAKSATYAVQAAKEHYGKQLNGAWMSTGQSQGGQASLGIAEYANNDPTYKGAVAGAPASSLGKIILEVAPPAIADLEKASTAVAVGTYATLLSYAALAGAGITAYDTTFDYRTMFQSKNAQDLAELAETECLGEMVTAYSADIQKYMTDNPGKKVMDYPGMNAAAFETNAVVKDFLTNKSQPMAKFLVEKPTEKLNKPVLIIQGTHDTNVPFVVTNGLYNQMLAKGMNVSLLPVNGAGHTQAIISDSGQASLVQFVKQHMPAQ